MVFVVLGMHKSGTTLISRMMHESGINMIDPVQEENPHMRRISLNMLYPPSLTKLSLV